MAKIVVLTTGGTLASRPDLTTGSVRVADSGQQLTGSIPSLPDGVDLDVIDVMGLGSYLMTPADMMKVVKACNTYASQLGVGGIVVTHGTDTMEETAYLVDLLYEGDVPVIFTGAQRNAAEPDADGPRNLSDAIRVAHDVQSRGIGAAICMSGSIEAARNAIKLRTQSLNAFGSPGHGPLGEVNNHSVAIYGRVSRPRNLIGIHDLNYRVDLIKLFPGIDATHLQAARSAGAAGIVVEALGAGNATLEVVAEVEEAVEAGTAILITSRCTEGFVAPIYGNGGGADLLEAGAIFAGNLRPTKARMLLLAALERAGGDVEALPTILAPHLSG